MDDSNPLLGIVAKFASTRTTTDKTLPPGFMRFYLQDTAARLLPHEKVAKCLRHAIPKAKDCDMLYLPRADRGFVSNLITCDSVWMCPVCAARITAGRRAELTQAVTSWRAQGGGLVMVTYTLSHNEFDRLHAVLDPLLDSYRAMRSGRYWRPFADKVGWAGAVKALEVTLGRYNGFHPHLHEVVFLEKPISGQALAEFQDTLRIKWLAQLAGRGRGADWEHGLLVETADQRIADYVAKYGHDPVDEGWTVAHEIVRGLQKLGREGSWSMWQLLMYNAAYWASGKDDLDSARFFKEYAHAFKGRSQLQWSRGLRDRLGLGAESPDSEVPEPLDDSVWLGKLTRDQVAAIGRRKLRIELREAIRQAGRAGNVEVLRAWLAAQNIVPKMLSDGE